MNAYRVSTANRRIVLLAVMSLIASLLTFSFNAPAARALPGTVVVSAATVDATEGGTTGTYDVRLSEVPSGPVTVTISAAGTEASANPTVLNFDGTTWGDDQSVVVTATDDKIDDDATTETLTHTPSGGGYDPLITTDVTVNVTDNDAVGITVVQTDGNTTVSEPATTDTYTIVLNSEPTDTVTVALSDGGSDEFDVNASVTFTAGPAGTWDDPQTVTVTAEDDAIVDGPQVGAVGHIVTSNDGAYAGFTITPVAVTTNDNDAVGITVVQTDGNTTVSEPATTDTYTIVLNSEPTDTVTVALSDGGSDEFDVNASVTFTAGPAGTWDDPQTVTVTAEDDAIVDGPQVGAVGHIVTSNDGAYAGFTITPVAVTTNDNDAVGITVVQTDGNTTVSEPATTDTYTIVLNSEPTDTVTVALSDGGSDEFDVNASVTFTAGPAGTWDDPQTVTVTAEDDAIVDGPQVGAVGHIVTSNDGAYAGFTITPVAVTTNDDDIKGVTINELGGVSVGEDGTTDTYTIVLDTEPTADVTITIAPTGTEATATTPLIFTAGPTGNWDDPQTVTVTAVDDAIDDGDLTETFTHTALGGDYAGISISNVIAATIDNDAKGVSFDLDDGVSASETGATDTYTIVLDTEPTADVTITIAPTGTEATATTPLIFTAGPTGNWDDPQTVTVTAVDDAIDDGDLTETFTHTALGGDYAGISISNVIAATIDNDAKGVTLTPVTVPVTEGATGQYTAVLDSEPTADVTISVTGDAQATALPGSLIFTAGPTGNWDDPQTVTVTAVDDMVAEAQPHTGTIGQHAATGGDYAGLTIGDVTVEITDNDSAGVSIDTGTGVTVTEALGAGHTDTYTIRLTTQPTADVTVSIADTSTEYSRAPSSLTFTSGPTGNWATPQTVTVTGTNDDVDDGDTSPSITHTATSGDGNYSGIGISSVSVSVIDDDDIGVAVSQVTSAVAEGGVADPYTVVLESEPTANVVVTLGTTTGEAQVDKPSLTFTPANWDQAQTVSITATDDDVIDGETTDAITHVAAGGGYVGVAIGSVAVAVTDDDVAGVTIVESDGSTDVIEGADTDAYTVVLDAEPGSGVVISIATDGQTTVSPTVLTFIPSNWDLPQTVTVSGFEDGIDETPSHPGLIQHTAAGDPDFVPVAITDVIANVGDSDSLLVTIDGPSVGAPGVVSIFNARVNAGGTGEITYEWTAFLGGNPVDTGDEASFAFTPTVGGPYVIQAIVGDSQGQNPAVFIQFRAMSDISASGFVTEIIWLAEEGITKGCNPPINDEFCPSNIVTREQMAAFLVRFLGLTDNGGGNTFTDDNGSIFQEEIARLAAAGITKGCNPADGNTHFCPTARVTHEQMAAFLVRALGLTDNGGGNTFTDDNGSIFQEEIARLAAAGITKGCNPPANTNFCPTAFVTRGQMAAFLKRADKILNP